MKIDGKTKLYGLIGYPVRHTFSPAMQNAAFCASGINAAYMAFEVKPPDLKIFLRSVNTFGICGLNVTIPHKSTCVHYIDDISREASLIGAVNTIVIKRGRLIGHNTDAAGFLAALRKELRFCPRGKPALVLGAGGAARAVTSALAMEGAGRILIKDVVLSRANGLADTLQRNFPGCKIEVIHKVNEALKGAQLLVNATPVGMKKSDPLLVDPLALHRKLKVYDLVYNLKQTRLTAAAKARGLAARTGISMLLEQGAEAFRLWTGQRPPVEAMRKALAGSLKI